MIVKPVTFGHDINWNSPRGNTIRGDRVLNGNPRDQRRPRLYIGITDNDWFAVVSRIPDIDKVNFWQPAVASNKMLTQNKELAQNKENDTQDAIEILINHNDK